MPRAKRGIFYLNSSELDCKSLIPGSKKQPEALHAFKSRGFGGEAGLGVSKEGQRTTDFKCRVLVVAHRNKEWEKPILKEEEDGNN